MAQEHLDQIDAAIAHLIGERRTHIEHIAQGYTGSDIQKMAHMQEAIEALQRARDDEESRLPSVYEERGIQEV